MASTPKFFDRVMASSTTSGTSTYTLGSAITGYQAWSVVGDGNSAYYCAQEVDGSGNPSGGWEVGLGTYATAGTTLTRDAILASSNAGAAVSWAAGTRRIFLVAPAAFQTYGGLIHQAGGADAAQTMQVGAMYVVDISAYTADRTYTLPAVAAVGDRCGIMLSDGDTAFELLFTAASGDTLIGSMGSIAGGTEYSRLFIKGETMVFRCIVANATWMVEDDGRIRQRCLMGLTTSATAETAATATTPTSKSGVWTAFRDNASIAGTSNDRITVRRAGDYNLTVCGGPVSSVTADNYFRTTLYKSGTSQVLLEASWISSVGSTVMRLGEPALSVPLVADDYVLYQFFSQEGSRGLLGIASPRILSAFSLEEILS